MLNLVSEFSCLFSAFQRVRENRGCAGVDGATIDRFEDNLSKNLSMLSRELVTQSYKPLPLLKILVDKGNGEGRALCVPAVRDRLVQAAVLEVIEPILENEFEDCSFAYRKGRSVKKAVYRVKEYYERGYRWVVDADVDSFFDSVNHGIMLTKAAKYIQDRDILKLIATWIKAEVWDGESLTTMQQGIPQGGLCKALHNPPYAK